MGWGGVILPPILRWFSLNDSETVKAVTPAFCSIHNLDRGISRFLVNPLKKKIVITPEPVMMLTWDSEKSLKLIRKTWQRHKNLTTISCQQIVMSLSFFLFMDNLEQFRSWVLGAWFVKLTLLLIIVFYLTITEKLSSRTIVLSKGAIFAKNTDFLRKCWHHKNWGGLGTKRYIYHLLYIVYIIYILYI